MGMANVGMRFPTIIKLGIAMQVHALKSADEHYRVEAWLVDYTRDVVWLLQIEGWLRKVVRGERWDTLVENRTGPHLNIALAGSPPGTMHFLEDLDELGGFEYA